MAKKRCLSAAADQPPREEEPDRLPLGMRRLLAQKQGRIPGRRPGSPKEPGPPLPHGTKKKEWTLLPGESFKAFHTRIREVTNQTLSVQNQEAQGLRTKRKE